MIKVKAANLVKYIVAKTLKLRLLFLPLAENGTTAEFWQRKHLLALKYTYRASEEGFITYQIQESGTDLEYKLYNMGLSGRQPVPGEVCFSFRAPLVKRGDTLRVNLINPAAWINERSVNFVAQEYSRTRKFIARLQMRRDQDVRTRWTTHYLPFDNKPIGKDYYFGDDYTEYPLHTDVAYALNLISQHYRANGRLLDIGCALGIYTKAFLEAGYDAYGIDISHFAVSEAAKRVGSDRIRQCNLDVSEIPYDGNFDVFWMWDSLEHMSNPEGALKKLTGKATPGAWLFLHTSNADSLSHRVLDRDWEGYSDYSHYGVDKVTATTLASWLNSLGWEVLDWRCDQFWVFGMDPVNLGLRDAFEFIPELKTFLSERDLGDTLVVVARKGTRDFAE